MNISLLYCFAQDHGHPPLIIIRKKQMKTAIGLDLYNQVTTEQKTMTLCCARSDPQHVPCVLVSMKQPKTFSSFGVVSKGNGECFLTYEKHMSLTVGGGQAGQGYPCTLTILHDR